MSAPDEAPTGSKGRPRGGPRRISRAKILEAARNFDPETMTMQAVADELGVDRKALNYHVTDRAGLLKLIAADVFESSFSQAFQQRLAEHPAGSDWERTLTAWCYAVRDGMVATGMLTNYYRIGSDDPTVFEPAELVLQCMIEEGFSPVIASRALILGTTFAMGLGRDIVLQRQLGEHPQGPEVRRVLETSTGDAPLGAIRAMVAAGINGPHDIEAQFEFEVETLIQGMRARRAE